MEKNKKNSVVL